MRLKITNRRHDAASAFTLVELLVVIAIIGILAALLLAAVGPTIDAANRARIKAEMEQFNTALEDYKNSRGAYPPNAQTDPDNSNFDNLTVLSNFRRHFNKAFPQNQEPLEVIAGLVGMNLDQTFPSGVNFDDAVLEGGMNAAESLVFWLGGFSSDPKYPITGPGGPSYPIPATVPNHQADPIESRSWLSGINVEQLGPRDAEGYFPAVDENNDAYSRYIVYTDPRGDGSTQRRINFWVLNAPSLSTPYLYFDASRGAGATAANDTPALTGLDGTNDTALDDRYVGFRTEVFETLELVYAIKSLAGNANATNRFRFANDGKFQILHPGTDETWAPMPRVNNLTPPELENGEAIFPTGPWKTDLTDTLTNFADGRLGDSQE